MVREALRMIEAVNDGMKKLATLLLLSLASGCGTSAPLTHSLYSDAEIVAVRGKFSSTNSWLEVVPAGQTKKMDRIFRELGLDPKRLPKPTTTGINMVRFYTWRVSPGFDLSVMTATNDPQNNFSRPMNLNGYGVRIEEAKNER